MTETTEYQILVGCNDRQLHTEVVSTQELLDVVAAFFESRQVDFSALRADGGYRCNNSRFVTESTLCVNLIGATEQEAVELGRTLAMFMNQDCALVVRNPIHIMYSGGEEYA